MKTLTDLIKTYVREANEYQWDVSTKKNTLLDKPGMEQSDKDNVENYLKSMGLMEHALLREYTRSVLLSEISALPKNYFDVIDDAVMGSRFWGLPNEDEDDPDASGSGKTPAARALEEALRSAFKELGLDKDVIVDSYFTDDPDYMLHPGHPSYPNKWLIDAKWYVSRNRPGRNTVDLTLMLSDEDSGFDIGDVDSTALVRHVTQSVRHELVHYTQMKKQSLKKGLYNDIAAFDEMLQDPSQIPNEDDPKYWDVYEPTGDLDEEGEEIINKDGFDQRLYTQDYLSSHIEIDAHAHDTAEELLAVYGEDGALDQLRDGFKLTDPKIPNAIQHYYEYLPNDTVTLQKLKSKMYRYIQHFVGQS